MAREREMSHEPPCALADMDSATRLHAESVEKGCAKREVRAPGAMSRAEHLSAGFVDFSAPTGKWDDGSGP
eukprot:3009654-Pyramimonas_sp.AAC.1